jgi:O-antigen biosynthesis protein
MNRKLRILVTTPSIPRPDISAGDRRLFELLVLLAKYHAVDLHPVVSPWAAEPGEAAIDKEKYEYIYKKIGVRILEGGIQAPLHRILVRRKYDVGLFEFWECAEWAAEIFRRFHPWASVIIDTVDVHFLREESGLTVGISDPVEVEAKKRRELATYRRADALIVITPEDRSALESCGGMPVQFLIPIVIPSLVSMRPRKDRPRDKELLFVGGFKHAPNVDGILWFAGEVWPAIRAAVPDAMLTVVGSHPPVQVLDLARIEGINVVGYVPEMVPYLDRAALSVAPLRYGAGMKGKVVEAMASGLAVVTTSVGAQGLGAVSGRHLAVADDSGEFVRRVVELLADPDRAERIGCDGREHVRAICSSEAVEVALVDLLAKVVERRRPMIPPSWWIARAALDVTRRMGRAMLGIVNAGAFR